MGRARFLDQATSGLALIASLLKHGKAPPRKTHACCARNCLSATPFMDPKQYDDYSTSVAIFTSTENLP
jgi:hypothetical protein